MTHERMEKFMSKATITGRLSHTGSKCGLRYAEIHAERPFAYMAQLQITGESEDDDDDTINADLERAWNHDGLVTIVCDVDEHGDLRATPSRITLLREGQKERDAWDEAARMRDAIEMIGSYPSGGLIDNDVSRERHEMIMIARAAQRGASTEAMKGLQQ